jgi:hypothetical protein
MNGGAETFDNVELLCSNCHKEAHKCQCRECRWLREAVAEEHEREAVEAWDDRWVGQRACSLCGGHLDDFRTFRACMACGCIEEE